MNSRLSFVSALLRLDFEVLLAKTQIVMLLVLRSLQDNQHPKKFTMVSTLLFGGIKIGDYHLLDQE